MSRMRGGRRAFIAAALTLGCAGAIASVACSLATQGKEAAGPVVDATSEALNDAVIEAPLVDAQDAAVDASEGGGDSGSTCNAVNCGGACCGDQCVSRTCQGCALGTLLCPYVPGNVGANGACVADCSQCDAGGVAQPSVCWACGQTTPAGSCTNDPNTCPAALDAGACACEGGDAGVCPGATQVCAGDTCLTCGQASTDTLACKGGKDCTQFSAACGP